MAESSSKKFQSPKGTRDFYPADLAVRRHIENVWRQASINHGFEEIDGPTFEYLDLYTHKSGPAIASELFQVLSGKDEEQVAAMRGGAAAPYALRPEFTPTLARMVAARAPELPRPIKWFAIPSHFRAESPQRGRLREFMQWNVDFIGDATPQADAEVIATAISALERYGLAPTDVQVHLHDRNVDEAKARSVGIEGDKYLALRWMHDNLGKVPEERLHEELSKFGIRANDIQKMLDYAIRSKELTSSGPITLQKAEQLGVTPDVVMHLYQVCKSLDSMGLNRWYTFNPSIVRGLDYYTGTVFEIHEASGAERAIAGGGRYDKLIESFGGSSLPACGFGMGDVVLANILKDKGLLKPAEEYLPRPDAFVIAANDEAAAIVPSVVANLRKHNLHIRQSYKATRNVGKLLGDAGKCRAIAAVIIDQDFAKGVVKVKDLSAGTQKDDVAVVDLAAYIDSLASPHRGTT